MRTENVKVFVSNADLALGQFICQDLLLGKNREKFSEVVCSVHDVNYGGNLWAMGGCLVKGTDDVKAIARNMQGCDVVVLVPDCTAKNMVQQAEELIQGALDANVGDLILVSNLGAEENTQTSKMFRQIEQSLAKSRMEGKWVVRMAPFQQCLFWYLPQIRQESRLALPWKQDEKAKVAMINLYDVACFVCHLCGEARRKRSATAGGEMFRLTGRELLNGKQLVDKMNQRLGGKNQIRFEEVDPRQAEEYLRKNLHFNDMMVRMAFDEYELINSGKLAHISNDEKKQVGTEPIALEDWVQENAHRFAKEQR